MFVVEDEIHAEIQDGEYAQLTDAMEELKRRASISWNEIPNIAPCTGWETCGRRYQIVEYDDSSTPWKEISRNAVMEINSSGAKWLASAHFDD